ncbi:hypothetical protein ASF60_17585 [Methylobacterium sp. Leaf113]|nr:hypothetical protein ASF60_17585 [Methylobacterium sp. Leaf113]
MSLAFEPIAEPRNEVTRMSACTSPAQSAFEAGTGRGVTPPFLPTLMMAVILGAASYLCHEPAAAPPPPSVPATAVAAAPETVVETPYIPAPLAFRTQFPMVVVAQAEPAAVQAHKAMPRPTRLAAPRRADPPRLATKALPAPSKPMPFAPEAEESPIVERAVSTSDEGILPEIALPFAPTIRAVSEAGEAAGAFMGAKGAVLSAETATLGAAVSGLVGRLR